MATEIMMHQCEKIRVAHHAKDNSNSIRLVVLHKNTLGQREALEILMFGLPAEATMKLMLAFADMETEDRSKEKAT